jgi:dihydroorotate dehydrogenase (fumarate)
MDLSTTYLGLKLPHPLIPGASPLADELDGVKQLEDAGAPMIVLRSLFEEQLVHEQLAAHSGIDAHENAFAEALSYLLPEGSDSAPSHIEHLARVKRRSAFRSSRRSMGHSGSGSSTPASWRARGRTLELNSSSSRRPDASGLDIEDRLLARCARSGLM